MKLSGDGVYKQGAASSMWCTSCPLYRSKHSIKVRSFQLATQCHVMKRVNMANISNVLPHRNKLVS